MAASLSNIIFPKELFVAEFEQVNVGCARVLTTNLQIFRNFPGIFHLFLQLYFAVTNKWGTLINYCKISSYCI